ncbi:FAR1-related sequence 5 [Prunus dulcis]|uniref:FAR1-related sequence 5 n=1 Tax=Prunus dulcis TaxID=3755 RepID=A0A5H2XLL1_PRUDU|nr:FAR1-related sequence 5 [Prunus dulcis]
MVFQITLTRELSLESAPTFIKYFCSQEKQPPQKNKGLASAKMDNVTDIESEEENPMIVNRTENFEEDLLGKVVSTEEEAYNLYNSYATRTGFSVRRGQKRYNTKKVLRQFSFRLDSDPSEVSMANKLETRTGCEARIRFAFQNDNEEVGGSQNVGFTKRDCYNVVNKEKMVMIEAGDAQSLINLFKRKQAEDPMFFYTVQVDQENRMTNFFWRDGRSRIDYDCFGDVVAMANGIEKVFPGVCHRLCSWHISQNAARNLGSYYGNPEFNHMFNKCLQGYCETELEFQSTWDDLLAKFNLTGNQWLKTLYSLRAKWCPVFSQHIFTAKIKSSQRSESTNVFHQMSTKTMSLTQFVHHYDKQAEKMRSRELEESFRCNQGLPSRIAKSSGLLNHAATIYTRKIFKLFEKEFVDSLGVMMHEVGSDGTIHSFELNEEGHKRRWTKDAKKGLEASDHGELLQTKGKSSVTLRRNTLMQTTYDVLTKASETENTTRIALQKLREIAGLIEKEMIKSKGEVNAKIHDSLDDCNATTFDETPVQNPSCIRPKGISNAKLKNVMEKRRRKTSKDIVSSRKTKQPSSIGPSYNSSHAPLSSNFLHPDGVPMSTNINNHVYPAISLLTTNGHAYLPPSNQDYNSTGTLYPSNFSFTSMLQSSDLMTQLNKSMGLNHIN